MVASRCESDWDSYYFFWVQEGKKRYYVQTPIVRSYIEEIP